MSYKIVIQPKVQRLNSGQRAASYNDGLFTGEFEGYKKLGSVISDLKENGSVIVDGVRCESFRELYDVIDADNR